MQEHGKLVIQQWDDKTGEKELAKRLKKCRKHRGERENGWRANELAVYTPFMSDDDTTNTSVQYADVHDAISSGYDRANLTLKGETTFAENRNTNASSVASGLSNAESNGAGSVSYVFNPFSSSSYTFHIMQGSFFASGNFRGQKMISVLKNVASVTGLNITFNGANCTGGTIKVFGLASN